MHILLFGADIMSLDKFLGTKKKTSSIKISKKKSKQVKTEHLEDDVILIDQEISKNQKDIQNTKYQFITLNLHCTAKCGYKKKIKRSKSFEPTEVQLKCPKCGKTMKYKK